ncbi:hypothetical protein JCM10450v2_001814 [Rhodotorula kratochvilovae]
MARDAGARKVIMASCAPPIRHPAVYGIDMPSRRELVAHGRTEEEISKYIGADLTIFQTLPDLVKACAQFNPDIQQFDCSVFTGDKEIIQMARPWARQALPNLLARPFDPDSQRFGFVPRG